MARSLLAFTVISLLLDSVHSAGKCDVSSPPTSWLVTTAIGITKWATAGSSADGDQFCVTRDPSTLIEVDYHIDLPDEVRQRASHLSRSGRDLWDNPYNGCVMDDPQIHVCFPFCDAEKQEIAIKAALSSGTPNVVAGSIEKSLNNPDWAITVLQVDFNNPEAHLNVTSFPDPNVWCSVYIGIDPRMGFPYLFEIQLGKVIQ
uniref:Protein C23H5.8, isoform a n=1 Tax=Haemonchus contortus TaxID=6289 RepID=A0A7I4YQ00_HAECO|nr:Protein C23H5.8, isoform a [Haemonchus contortus]